MPNAKQEIDDYCPSCGACGEEGCCSPDRCNCQYREHYDETYATLLKENKKMYDFIKLVNSTPDVSLDELPVMAAHILEDIQ